MILEIRRVSAVLKTETWFLSHGTYNGLMATVSVKLKCAANVGPYYAIFDIKHEKKSSSNICWPHFGASLGLDNCAMKLINFKVKKLVSM